MNGAIYEEIDIWLESRGYVVTDQQKQNMFNGVHAAVSIVLNESIPESYENVRE